MFRALSLGFVLVLSGVSETFAFGLTVDQMYRNVVVAEQEKAAAEEPLLAFKKVNSKSEAIWKEKKVYFEKRTQKPDEFEAESPWEDIVAAVKNGSISPFDLAEIRRQSENENIEAIELLAWMYATGTGIRQDLTKSYTYYLQAAHMGLASANDNIRAVYKMMSPAQRAALPSF